MSLDDLFLTNYTDAKSAGTDEIIAPGTKNSTVINLAPTANFAPEVAYEVVLALNIEFDEDFDGTQLTWTVNTQSGLTAQQAMDAVAALSATYNAGDEANLANITIGWEWSFDGTMDDTGLENIANAVSVEFSIVANQLDTYTGAGAQA